MTELAASSTWTPSDSLASPQPPEAPPWAIVPLISRIYLLLLNTDRHCHSGYQAFYLLNHIFVTYCLKLGPNNTNKLCEIPVYFRR